MCHWYTSQTVLGDLYPCLTGTQSDCAMDPVQWGRVLHFNPLVAPPFKGVMAWTEVGHSVVLVFTSHRFLYYANAASIIRLNFVLNV